MVTSHTAFEAGAPRRDRPGQTPRRGRGGGAGRRRLAAGSAATLCVALLAACGSGPVRGAGTGSTGSSGPGQTITLYNAQHEQTTDALISAFTRQTGIKVRVKNDDEDDLVAEIEAEGSRSPADVIYTENSNWLQQLDAKGLLAKVDTATLASVPRIDSATNGDWLGVSARVSVLVYNTTKVPASGLPASVLDLADPQWRGKIEIAPAETDFWPIVDNVARLKGDTAAVTWLRGLKANAGSNDDVPDNETLTSDVNDGVTDLALINSYYFYRLEAEVGAGNIHAKLAYFSPRDPGYVEDVSGAAVLASSAHRAAAQRFLAFLTSRTGQEVLAHSESFEYPLHPGVAANAELPPLSTLQPSPFTPAQLGSGLEARQLLLRAGLV